MLLTLRNNFHNTEARVRVDTLPATLTAGQVDRAWRKLCGLKDCTCSGKLGTRGPQGVIVDDYPTQGVELWPKVYEVDAAMLGQEFCGSDSDLQAFCDILRAAMPPTIEVDAITSAYNGANNTKGYSADYFDDDIEKAWDAALALHAESNPDAWNV